MNSGYSRIDRVCRLISLSFLLVFAGGLAACAPATIYSLDIDKQSGLAGKLTPEEAVKVVGRVSQASGVDADHGTFALDTRGFRFTKTITVTRQAEIDGKMVAVEIDEPRIQQVAWQAVSEMTPLMRKTVFGDVYAVDLHFSESSYVSSTSFEEFHELELQCFSYEKLIQLTAALRVLTGL